MKIVIVTPESTTLDQEADFVVLPLVDGEAGVSAGHAPMIGRLGAGELRVKSGGSEQSFFVDGGNVQIEGDVVSVLTGSSTPAKEIDIAQAKEALATAEAMESDKPALAEAKRKAISQARAKIRVAEKAR